MSDRQRAWLAARRRSQSLVVATSAMVVVLLVAHHRNSPPAVGLHLAAEHGALMAAAMLPLTAPAARLVAERALVRRWVHAVAAHSAGFASVWLGVGVAFAAGTSWVGERVGRWPLFSMLLVLAAVWQQSFARRRRVGQAGRIPLGPPVGIEALCSEFAGGADQGRRCVGTCWAAMAAMAAAPGMVVMAVVAVVAASEFAPGPNPHARRRQTRPIAAYAAMAVGAAIVGLSPRVGSDSARSRSPVATLIAPSSAPLVQALHGRGCIARPA